MHVKGMELLYSNVVYTVYGIGNMICIMGGLQHLDPGLFLIFTMQHNTNFINP